MIIESRQDARVSAGTSAALRAALAVSAVVIVLQTAADSAPWPARLYEFPIGTLPATYAYEDMTVTVSAAEDEPQEGVDTLGPVREFRIDNLRTGRSYYFVTPSIGSAILLSKDFYPEIEVWTRAGGNRYARCAFRWVKRQYCCLQVDEFVAVDAADARPGAPFTIPGSATAVRFAGSRAGECDAPAE